MNVLICDRSPAVAAWVAERMPRTMTADEFGDCTAIGVADAGLTKMLAGVVYHEYRGFDVWLSMAADSPAWAQRGTIYALMAYPFEQMGVRRVTTFIGKQNKRARAFNRGLGFKEEGVLKHAYDGHEDACVYGLTREDWQASAIYRSVTRGQENTLAAAAA